MTAQLAPAPATTTWELLYAPLPWPCEDLHGLQQYWFARGEDALVMLRYHLDTCPTCAEQRARCLAWQKEYRAKQEQETHGPV